MIRFNPTATLLLGGLLTANAAVAATSDWPQWRGAQRDASVWGFEAPAVWPKSLTQQWKVVIGDGIATPALVGNRIYTFSSQNGNEIARCLDAESGKELWRNQYPCPGISGPASSFSGPRCSPAVAAGKVVTLGVHGMLSCLDAKTGEVVWRKDDFNNDTPRFGTASSPMIVGGVCIAQLGGQNGGAVVAYDMATGAQTWKHPSASPAYASPMLMSIDKDQYVIAETERTIGALNVTDGKTAWEAPFEPQDRMDQNAASPVVDGQTLIYSGGGRGLRAVEFQRSGAGLTARDLWKNANESLQFSSPAIKDGFLYGVSQANDLFCVDMKTGEVGWSTAAGAAGGAMMGRGGPGGAGGRPDNGGRPRPGGGGRPGGGRGGGGGGGGGGARGFATLISAGTTMIAMTPSSELVVFAPDGKRYNELARIKVADSPTYAYPIVTDNQVLVKDQDALTSWSLK